MKLPTHSFILRTDRFKNGKNPIVIKLYFNGKNKYINTPFSVSKNEWLSQKERAKYNVIINAYLDGISEKYNRLLMEPLNYIDVNDFACYLFDLKNKEHKLVDYISKFIQSKIAKNDVKPKSIGRYTRMSLVVNDFLKYKNIENIRLIDVNFSFIDDFDTYLKSQLLKKNYSNLKVNTVNKYHSLFKAILLFATNEGYLKSNPYQFMKLKGENSFRCHLTLNELNKFKSLKIENPTYEKTRLIYLFSCYTGFRFQDALDLLQSDIKTNDNKNFFISIISDKSNNQLELPLLDLAVSIINESKEKFGKEIEITKKVLPQICNSDFNKYLKTIAEKLQINKSLSHHTARHTFATLMLSSGMSPQALQPLLGHKNLRETMYYAKITPIYLAQELNKGNQLLKTLTIKNQQHEI